MSAQSKTGGGIVREADSLARGTFFMGRDNFRVLVPTVLDGARGVAFGSSSMRGFLLVMVMMASACNMTVQAGGCGPGNCVGCCSSSGQCVSGIEPSACGSTGSVCSNCSLSGLTCQLGQCVQGSFNAGGGTSGTGGGLATGGGSSGSCGPATCDGCCVDGTCQLGVFDTECGARGSACGSCGDGRCSAFPKAMDGSSQGGRCLGGSGGGTAAGGGTTSSECNLTNCRNGCCDSRGVCQPGTSTSACGESAAACQACSSSEVCAFGKCDLSGAAGGSAGGGSFAGGGGSFAGGGGSFAGGGGSFAGGGGSFAGGGGSFAGGGGSFAGGFAAGGGAVAGGGGSFAGGSSGGSSGGSAGGSAGGVVSGTGETCATAVLVTSPGSRSGTLSGFVNDYGSGSGCLSASGPDRVYRLQVGSAARVSVTVTPSTSWDVSLSATVGTLTRCEASPRTCDNAIDAATAGNAETIDLATSGDDVFVVVDSTTTTVGAFTLSWSIQPLTAGDRCEAPLPLQSGVATTGTTFGFTNDYTAGLSCASLGRMGADVVYAVQVGPGQGLDVRVAPSGAMLDTSISIATSMSSCRSQCVTGANTGVAGAADVAFWNNVSASTVTAYVIVDSSSGSSAGAFTITATIGAQVTCNATRCPTGCCQNNQCVVGSEDTACGQQGNACAVCGQYQQCQNAVCTDAPRPTGAPCAMNTQCYGGTLASPVCRASWPNGGYCSSTCLLEGFDCGGLPLIAPGYCVGNVCLEKCSSPGTGQSTCRSSYVCEFSGGSGSQGVCVPRCQNIACTTGTCQTTGYCR